jgi:predicted secreted protein
MLWRRHTLASLTVAVVILAAASWVASVPADAASTSRNLRLGNSWEFLLEGNPSTGYRWELNQSQSTGLDLVKIESLGYVSAKAKPGLVGAPAPFAFRITCIKAGSAHLMFGYVPPTRKSSSQQHEAWVRCD